jgi:cytochrome c oxidase cbb3-type subunit 1
MPTLSTIACVFVIVPVLAVALNVYQTIGRFLLFAPASPALAFVLFGVAAFILTASLKAVGVLFDVSQTLSLTWYTSALTRLGSYGFFAMVMFGAIYCILPQLIGIQFPWPKLIRAHFLVAAAGLALSILPLAIGGVLQSVQLQNPNLDFNQITKSGLIFLRVSMLGDLLLLLGQLFFLRNLVGLTVHFYRARAVAAYEEVTTDLFKTAGAKP